MLGGSEVMENRFQLLERGEICRFMDRFMDLHDADVTSINVSNDHSMLTVHVEKLCLIDPETDWWRITETKASIEFSGVTVLEIEGELVKSRVFEFNLNEDKSFRLFMTNCKISGVVQRLKIEAVLDADSLS